MGLRLSQFSQNTRALLKEIVKRHKWQLLVGIAALVAVDLLQLYVPRLIKHAVDDLTQGTATASSLLYIAGFVVALALLIVGLRMAWRPLLFGFSRAMERDLRMRLFDHLQKMHWPILTIIPPAS